MGANAESIEIAHSEPRGQDVVSLIIVNAVVDALASQRVPVSEELAAARERFHVDARAVMPRPRFLRELERAYAAQRDPALGLALGESLNEMSFQFMGPLIASQLNLRDTMGMFLRLSRNVLGGPRWTFVQQGDDVIIGYALEPELGRGAELEAELGVTAVQRTLAHWLGVGGRHAVSAQFGFDAPPYLERYRALFGSQVRFAQSLTGVRFPAALLEKVRTGATDELARGLREFGERWLPREDPSWSARVRQEFAITPNLSQLSFDDLAKRWGLSSRSLRRRLASEDASLSTLLEEARLTRAR
ncbi:MAG TPA: AraC family transcriptional regulator ligand-binding domain-containing protein, partial [Polyangiales bacterium]|nr:AraC family transcriptional regulator ligand-binding domain-containing protein [Polyangiales bacterium]